MNKINYLIAFSVALFWACSDSPSEAGTTEIDNTVAQNESSSSTEQDIGISSSSAIKQSSASVPQSSADVKLSSSVQTTSSASQQSSSSKGNQEASPAFAKDTKNGIKLGGCITSGLQTLAKRAALAASTADASNGLPQAYILNDGEGHYQVMALKVRDACLIEADLLTKRSGDTLQIDYGVVHSETTCSCYSDHWFDIEPENANVKFIQIMFFNGTTYQVSDGPAPEPSKATSTDSTFTDTRDGKTYRTVKLGDRIWMAENLNYEIKDSLVSNCNENGGCDMGFPSNRPQSWCNGNKQENCDKYGRLYNFEAAKVACPPGWSLPAVEEWPERGNGGFSAFLDYAVVGWGGGKDSYGFSILPAGDYTARSQYFLEPGRFAFFWTSTIDTRNNNCATMIHFGNGSEGMVSVCADDENDGHSVRCVKD